MSTVNDYKKDQDKPPMLDALVPFYPALRALAAMMSDMKAKHKLEGAKDPFNEWRQLPNAKARLMNAAGGHLLQGPWKVNEKDGNHLHAVHALFGLLAGITIHVEENKPATKAVWVVWDPTTDDYCLGVGDGTTKNASDAMKYEHRIQADSHAQFAPRWQVKQVIV